MRNSKEIQHHSAPLRYFFKERKTAGSALSAYTVKSASVSHLSLMEGLCTTLSDSQNCQLKSVHAG